MNVSDSVPLPVWFGTYGGDGTVFVDMPDTTDWTATLSADAASWVVIAAGTTGRGPGLVKLSACRNTTDRHTAELTVTPAGAYPPRRWPLVQMSAVPVATMNASVLAVPFFPRTPTVMELGIAGGFIAKQVKKIPEPFTLLALLVVEIVVILLGVLAIMIRSMLSALVPEPKTWFGAPEPYDPLTQELPATAVFIIEETSLTAVYIAEQTLAGK